MLSNYKQWTGKQRQASLRLTKKAIADGIIPPPTKCSQCGKTTGRIDYHNENYDDPIKYLTPLCMSCHLKLHREWKKNEERLSSKETLTTEQPDIVEQITVIQPIISDDFKK